MVPETEKPILFFDGVCNLCNRFIQIVIKNDRLKQIMFSSLQSGAGEKVKGKVAVEIGSVPDSLILQYNNKLYYKSNAVLKVANIIGGRWKLLSIGYVLPRFIRDSMYDLVAKNRYKLFGKQDECMVPTPDLVSRFIK